MKGLSTTILIVVTAVVILVAALVLLTIFGSGIGNVSTLTNFRTQCIVQCQITCKMGALPPTWEMTVKVQGTDQSCGSITNVHNTCSGECGSGTTTSGKACTGTPPTCTGDAGCKVCADRGSQYCGIC